MVWEGDVFAGNIDGNGLIGGSDGKITLLAKVIGGEVGVLDESLRDNSSSNWGVNG